MAYMSFSEVPDGAVVGPASATGTPASPDAATGADASMRSFTPLEWSVVALAERDRLSTLRAPGRFARVMERLFRSVHDPRLADGRLEALRRMAVLSWHHGFVVPGHEVRAFVAAGYSSEQYESLVTSITAVKVRRRAVRR